MGTVPFCAFVTVRCVPAADAIVVDRVVKRYGDVHAVDHVTLTIRHGEFFGILGPNGAGKTTLLEMIEGLREPDAGTLEVLGMPSWPRNPALLPRIGVQLQATAFFERLTAREQVRTFAALYGVSSAPADAMLNQVGLEEKADTPVEKLSGGQAQRLSIACALVHDPDVLFLDEPSAALDPQARRNLWDLLRSVNEGGRTVVLTTHHMDEAEALCDRVAIMDHGAILTVGAPADLVRGLDVPRQIIISRTAIDLPTATGLPGVDAMDDDGTSLVISTRDPGTVVGALGELRALDGVQIRGANLEDVFIQLTGREYRA